MVGQYVLMLYWLEYARRDLFMQQRMKEIKGIFALRSPHRPNPIGAAILPIEEIGQHYILVRGLDCLERTPLLDIKPAMMNETA